MISSGFLVCLISIYFMMVGNEMCIRDRANVDRDRSGQNIVFVNEDLKQVYHELFDACLLYTSR